MRIIIITFMMFSLLHANISSNVTIVYITDETLEKYGTFPLTRNVYADYIDSIYKNYSPKVTYLNFTIDLPDRTNISLDKRLFESVQSKNNIVFAGLLSKHTILSKNYINSEINSSRIKVTLDKDSGAFLPLPELINSGAHFGIFNLGANEYGEIISFPFVYNIENYYYPSALLKIISLYKKSPLNTLFLEKNKLELQNIYVDNNIHHGQYYPRLTYEFNTFSYQDIINGRVPEKYINNRIVLLGINATGVKKTIPTEDNLHVESTLFLANSIESILKEKKKIDRIEKTQYYIISFLFIASFLVFLFLRFRRARGLPFP